MKNILFVIAILLARNVNAGDFSVGATLGAVSVGNSWIKDGDRETAMIGLSGLLSIGADVEYFQDKDYSFGAYLKYQGTGDDISDTTEASFSNLALGAMVKGYLNSRNWSFYFGGGLGLLSVSYELEANTKVKYSPGMSIGPMLVLGGLYPVSERFWLGLETMQLFAFGEDLNGAVSRDWVLKAKYDL